MSSSASVKNSSTGSWISFFASRSWSSYQSPSASAFWKIVGKGRYLARLEMVEELERLVDG